MSDTTPSPRPRPPRRSRRTGRSGKGIRIALAISLAVNLLVVGLVVGAILRGDRDHRPDTALADIGFGPFIHALPPEDRKALAQQLVDRAGTLRENREAIRAQFQRLLDALRAQPFEIDAVAVAVDAQQQQIRDRIAIGKELLFARIEDMTDAERAAFADALERGFKRGPRIPRSPPPRD